MLEYNTGVEVWPEVGRTTDTDSLRGWLGIGPEGEAHVVGVVFLINYAHRVGGDKAISLVQ